MAASSPSVFLRSASPMELSAVLSLTLAALGIWLVLLPVECLLLLAR